MKKVFLMCVALLGIVMTTNAYTERNLLQKTADLQKLKQSLVLNQKWVPYPDYSDRAGWDKMLGDWKQEYIARGEKSLHYEWITIKATDYLTFERTGDRSTMENPYFRNERALCDLIMAEIAEGKGRFLDQIINGTFHFCEMTTWALAAHTDHQPSGRVLPTMGTDVFDIFAGDIGTIMAWTHYFLGKEMDKVDPEISRRIRYEVKHRILDTIVDGPHIFWMVDKYEPGMQIINWTSWSCFNALMCYMLIENDIDRLARGVYRTMQIMDKYINYFQEDGACEEGPSYWDASPGKLYDYLQHLDYATAGKVNIFKEPIVRRMGEYISRAYIGNGWVVNFSDAPSHGGGNPSLAYRFGKAVGSQELMSYGAFLEADRGPSPMPSGKDISRSLQTCLVREEFAQASAQRQTPATAWYPNTELCYIRDAKSGFTFAAKGGYYIGGHYHCDLGSFILYKNNVPMFIDLGAGTYTRAYFREELRYDYRVVQSDYHTVPKVNGFMQGHSNEYRTASASFNERSKTFTTDLATAYPSEAGINQWLRTYTLKNGVLKINDKFSLKDAKVANELNFMTWGKVDGSKPGIVTIQVEDQKLTFTYDTKTFNCEVEKADLQDPKVHKAWNDSIYRIRLVAKATPNAGSYTCTIK